MLHRDTWKFSRAAKFFMDEGKYTKEARNPNPVSKYMRFWYEEAYKCLYGHTEDNTTITGYHYYYLNYSPILKATISNEVDELVTDQYIEADRIEGFPDFWDGDFDYFHYLEDASKMGEHGIVLKARSKGYSFKGSSMCDRNYFLIPRSKSYVYAYDSQFLTKDGILNKAWDIMDFNDQHCEWKKRRLVNSMEHKQSGYEEKDETGTKYKKGFKSEIIGISINDGYKKVRGKRGKLILFEEAGANPYLLKAWNVAENSMKSGNRVFGTMVAFGTGGEEDTDIVGLTELFYNKGYGVHHISNKWDKGHRESHCGFFVPMSKNLDGFMDKDGNSLEDKATEFILQKRDILKNETKDIGALIRKMAEEPLTPREALMRAGDNFFPINDLNDILANRVTDTTQEAQYTGKLVMAGDGTVSWKTDDSVRPITEFPLKYDGDDTKSREGCVVIWEMPFKNKDGVIPSGMYIAATDPYDHDEAGSSDSLGSTFVMNRVTDRIVAEYTGRPATAKEYYENVRKLLIFFNARDNYENNLKGMFSYFENMNSAYLLSDTPRCLYDKIDDKAVLNRKKGSPGTLPIKRFGLELYKSWLLTPNQSDGKLNMYSIKSIPLLKETIYFSLKNGNYDRVLAMVYLMILREESMRIVIDANNSIKTPADDPFWKRHYNTLNKPI